MPSPILHAGAALAMGKFLGPVRPRILAWASFLAIWPDLDLLPGLLMGDPHLYHHGPTHSILVQALVAVAVSRFAGVGLPLALTAALSHCALDLFNHDPFGDTPAHIMALPLFWPLGVRVPMLAPLLPGAHFSMDPRAWFAAENVAIFGRDVTLAALAVAVAEGARRLFRRQASALPQGLAEAR